MRSSLKVRTIAAPGLMFGDYPERIEPAVDGRPQRGKERLCSGSYGTFKSRAERVRERAEILRVATPADFAAQRSAVCEQFAREGFSVAAIDTGCAYAVEGARHALGKDPYDCQIVAALAMLDQNLVEMATGEGKSLAMALAAAVAGLAGIPVHVLTANDYLVVRDATEFAPLFALMGLNVAAVTAEQSADARRNAYGHRIVYVCAREVAFDYLRDRLQHGCGMHALQRHAIALAEGASTKPLLRGLCMALIDEADNILIDEAQMPLVLSRSTDNSAQRAFLWQAFMLSGELREPEDFTHLRGERRILLTDRGRDKIDRLAARLAPMWRNRAHREDIIVTALTARHAFSRNRDYVVADGKIQIIDAVSGRIASGRKWGRGLHGLVSLKEGCALEADLETLTQITFQRFFRRYLQLGGMSGTLAEARRELADVYGLAIVPIPPRLPSRRQRWATRFFVDDRERWRAVVGRVRELRAQGRPVLVGTDSVADSHELSVWLTQAGIGHVVLNANNDRAEAEIVARAGCSGTVTVSTNMAGRGTDIHPDDRALQAGGLHVLSCQHNASRRHDRQLAGRAGRQGQPGTGESWISLDSPRFTADGRRRGFAALCRRFAKSGEVRLPTWLLHWILTDGQRAEEARQLHKRRLMLRHDITFELDLTFCGPDQ
jgi:preprotein translocase subunit SecA